MFVVVVVLHLWSRLWLWLGCSVVVVEIVVEVSAWNNSGGPKARGSPSGVTHDKPRGPKGTSKRKEIILNDIAIKLILLLLSPI